ncbi:hypothetical protein M2103_002679 [Ereboglobus sp. PH5-5]|uniref:DUF2017 family protein n=1 Tax=Ereboglobus sp. PH5-5 TaxID=2940529 RepID=UPI002404D9EB|nr:hypothetical protein [Ereboglobus sp. PH5-5]MDF9834428.1 hypothetical protein [Ereboglobus sp. PH5-5]
MSRIEITLSLKIVAPLLDLLNATANELKTQLAVQLHPPANGDDAEMDEMWRNSLLSTQNESVGVLLALFDGEFFETGTVTINTDESMQIIRACTALRLQMRLRQLADIPDETLEQGIGDFDALQPDTRRALMAYMFLATLQELIIRHVEP